MQKNRSSNRLNTIYRYPGGKALPQARNQVRAYFPDTFSEYREPFCGGAGLFFTVDPAIRRWINDMNPFVVAPYLALKERPREFIELCRSIAPAKRGEAMATSSTGKTYPKSLYDKFHDLLHDDDADPALRFLFLNRHSMFGRVRLEPEWRHRTRFNKSHGWTRGLFRRLEQAVPYFADAIITCGDFAWLFDEPGDNVFIYADPPYVVETKMSRSSKLYEHGFTMNDHVRFRDTVARCRHQVLVSYGDDEYIRELYRDFYIHEATWTYMGRRDRSKGKELLITNYPVVRTAQIIVPSEMKTWVKKSEPEDERFAVGSMSSLKPRTIRRFYVGSNRWRRQR